MVRLSFTSLLLVAFSVSSVFAAPVPPATQGNVPLVKVSEEEPVFPRTPVLLPEGNTQLARRIASFGKSRMLPDRGFSVSLGSQLDLRRNEFESMMELYHSD